VPLRMNLVDELLGADYSYHAILHPDVGLEEAVEILSEVHPSIDTAVNPTGKNIGTRANKVE